MDVGRWSQDQVTSRDGTRVGFLRGGRGPGVVLVQGAMATATDYLGLGSELTSDFTVLIPDRRGRGASPKPYDERHRIERDVEDVGAVLDATAASRVFGLSSGAMVTLAASLALPEIERVAVYEPPFRPGGPPASGVARLKAELDRGDLAGALVTSLLTSGTAPTLLGRLPRSAARALAAGVLAFDARRPSDSPPLRDLLPGIRYDFDDVVTMNQRLDRLAKLQTPVLLMKGTRSPVYLRGAADRLDGLLPRSQLVELDGLGHAGPWNQSRGGRPELVAAALRPFFA